MCAFYFPDLFCSLIDNEWILRKIKIQRSKCMPTGWIFSVIMEFVMYLHNKNGKN